MILTIVPSISETAYMQTSAIAGLVQFLSKQPQTPHTELIGSSLKWVLISFSGRSFSCMYDRLMQFLEFLNLVPCTYDRTPWIRDRPITTLQLTQYIYIRYRTHYPGARGSIDGWGVMLQAKMLRCEPRWDHSMFFNLLNPFSRTRPWGLLSP
jgi:hypothetical protein